MMKGSGFIVISLDEGVCLIAALGGLGSFDFVSPGTSEPFAHNSKQEKGQVGVKFKYLDLTKGSFGYSFKLFKLAW